MQGHDEYACGHVLIRDVAYARLTRDERARLHASTARWLEAVSGDRVNEVAELIAHHLSTSYELSPADDPEMKRRIYRFLMTAWERAAMLDAKAALALARRAVEFASDDRELGRALIEVGQGLFSSTDEAISGFETAIDALQRAGDREGEVKATMWLGRLRWYMGDGGASDALGDRVLELVEGLPASSVVADAIVAVASGLQLHGREDEALDLVERGLAVAQAVGDTRVFARALVIKGSAVIQIGDAEGLGDIEEGLKIQLDLNEARAAMSTYNNLATVLNDNGDSHRSREQITEAIALGEARGLTSQVDWSHLTLVESLFMLGEWDRLWTILDEREDMERIRGTQIHMALRFWRCLLLHFRGNPKQAWQMFPSILDLARDAKDPQAVVPSVAFGIGMALDAGEVASGRRLVSELVELSAEHPVFLGFHLSWAGGAVAQLGMLDELALLSRRAGRSYPWIALRMQSVDAVLSASAGRHSEAFELLEPLIIEADQRGIRVVAMAARIQAARSAVALGDTDGANELLDAAARDAGLMGAGLFLQRIDEIRGEAEAATGT
jgi:tetratricopeptide (TPR) repeat protein